MCGIFRTEDNRFVDNGRPYSGLVFLGNNNQSNNIRYKRCSPNKRVMALLIRVKGS